MSTIICRVGFCKACFDANRPHKDSVFLVYGSYREKYYARTAMRSGTRGYTPHLFILNHVTKANVCVVEKVCAMCGCGVEYRPSKAGMVYGVIPDKWAVDYFSIADWNALLMDMKRDRQYTL